VHTLKSIEDRIATELCTRFFKSNCLLLLTYRKNIKLKFCTYWILQLCKCDMIRVQEFLYSCYPHYNKFSLSSW